MNHNDKILITKHVSDCRLKYFQFGAVLLTGLKWLRSNLSITWYDLTPTGQRGKLYEKIFFKFDFHILPEHRRIGDKNFPCRCISIKNSDHPWGRCWPIYLESKPSQNCWIAIERAEITFISIHINANQNSYHDDTSIYILLTRALCPQLLRNLRTRRRFDSSSIIAHPVNFDKDRQKIVAKNPIYIDIIDTNSSIIDMDFLYR